MRPTSSQFHQHFTYEFFVRTLFRQLFSSYMYVEKAAATLFVQKNWHQRYLFGAFFHKLNTNFGLFLDVFVILRSIDFKVKLFVSCIKCKQFENALLKLARRAFLRQTVAREYFLPLNTARTWSWVWDPWSRAITFCSFSLSSWPSDVTIPDMAINLNMERLNVDLFSEPFKCRDV